MLQALVRIAHQKKESHMDGRYNSLRLFLLHPHTTPSNSVLYLLILFPSPFSGKTFLEATGSSRLFFLLQREKCEEEKIRKNLISQSFFCLLYNLHPFADLWVLCLRRVLTRGKSENSSASNNKNDLAKFDCFL